ncbi:hypothetical protein [Vibrio tapetis]|uniref:Uncharacterized protein n=1 Tax=Vibrio tapetis subsp. tapetis TaxID=1671868 RepID=A0A2N8ZJS2_9VIBR|nr:hypothetical protein [Vibrio tapetis]SON52151.1 conserved exported protein of unknown function [Vibrio tapetis subsp. tapetis]
MKDKLNVALLLVLSSSALASSNIDSVLLESSPCTLPSDDVRSHQCSYQNKPFVYEKSIWEDEDESSEVLLDFWDGTRLVSDKEWQSMDINRKVLNQKRNECARRHEVDCVVFDKD